MTTAAAKQQQQQQPIRSTIPARLDRLRWSPFHTRLVLGLGTAWILDGLEITIASSVSGKLTQGGTLNLSTTQASAIGTVYLVGEVVGALVFGRLSDKLGRRKLFMWTLAIYLVGTGLSALAFKGGGGLVYFYATRFIAGTGIGGEYSAVNSAIDEMMTQGRFGDAGRRIVVENFLRGTECSLHALVDGNSYRLLESARDHKRALDGDQGPNTGGMGAFSPANNWNDKLRSQFETKIMQPLLSGLLQQGITFRGLLYPGLIITSDGARVLEFNCRFGDPETQVLLPRMKSDLLPLLEATIDGTLAKCAIEWDTRAAVTVVLASGGYPGKYETGKTVSGLDDAAKLEDVQIFHAGTKRANGGVKTAGGRVLAVTALGSTLEAARARAYEAVSRIHFENCHYRRDIALGVNN